MRGVLGTLGLALACFAIFMFVQGDSGDEPAAPVEPPAETADPLPPLPRGWTKAVNETGGFAIGVPPRWSRKDNGPTTTLTAPGNVVVARVTANRSAEALAADLDEYAREILDGLAGAGAAVEPQSEVSGPAGLGYESASAVGTREHSPGRTQSLQVVVVRRPELAAYPILIAGEPGARAAVLRPTVATLVDSLRGRPASP